MSGYGVVLGGGGAKGAYEIGVWKALKGLNIPIKVITGTSVGALNGAAIVQGDYDAAWNLWTSLKMESVIKIEKAIAQANDAKDSLGLASTIRNFVKSGGLDVTPLKTMLQEILDEERIRKSPMDLGIVTFSLTDFKPVQLFKAEIPEGKLIDYLIASACFPAFKPHEIDDKKFIDGGVYNNIPLDLMKDKGVKDIIVVDVAGPGIVRKVNTDKLNVINIKNSGDLGGVLDFNGERSLINIEMGYLDTLKKFGKLKGSKYYFHSMAEAAVYKENYVKTINMEDFKKVYSFLGLDWGEKSSARNELIIYKIMKTLKQYSDGNLSWDTILPAMAEITAEQIGIERIKTYDLEELINEILEEYEKIKAGSDFDDYIKSIKNLILSRNQAEFNREVKKVLIEGKFLIYYNPDMNEKDEKVKNFRRFIAMAFPKVSIANMFISLLLSRTGSDSINRASS
ncbi:NTE family protein RssA [Oxobacter pfennigii]|uniref:NTE family protein RssA n=1 Tax=Oxobacter pfennigii TaxID=36849 RepID=A0A0N8NT49_9CLOT|nr:patatin-like phospholipase family protein [Oxobacter pfennigii]KPU43840.1 NTE family protein RssA [Oxobacter pfennigii]